MENSSIWPASLYNNDRYNISNDSVLTTVDILGPQYHRTARVIIIITMIILSIVGNSIVCSRITCQRGRLTKPKVLFLNLALADLGVTLVTMTSQLVWELMGRLWIAGDAFCRIFKVLQTFALVSSTYMLVAIAIDRYFAIVRPLRPSPRPWRLAQGAWFASLLPSLPNLYVFHEWENTSGNRYCSSIFYTTSYPPSHRQIYMAYVFLSIFIVPFSLLVGLYVRILARIWKQSSAIDQRSGSSLPKAKVKTLKLAVVIFTAFMITNLPYVVQEMILAFGHSDILDTNCVALFGVISASNSALNPYIFLAFQSKLGFSARWRALVKSLRSSSSNISRMGERLSLTLRTSRSIQAGRTSITSASTVRSPRLED